MNIFDKILMVLGSLSIIVLIFFTINELYMTTKSEIITATDFTINVNADRVSIICNQPSNGTQYLSLNKMDEIKFVKSKEFKLEVCETNGHKVYTFYRKE